MKNVETNLKNTIEEIKKDIADHSVDGKTMAGYEYLEDLLSGAKCDLKVLQGRMAAAIGPE